MASIIVRELDESVKKRLAARAREHGRSMEAEVREILTRGCGPTPHRSGVSARCAGDRWY